MQTLLLPACRSAVASPSPPCKPPATSRFSRCVSSFSLNNTCDSQSSLKFSFLPFLVLNNNQSKRNQSFTPISASYTSPGDQSDNSKLAQVSKRLESTSRYFKRLGGFGFWGQLVSTLVSAVILSFSIVITGRITSPVTFYSTAGGIAAAFLSVFWSFGYIRLSDRLRKTVNDPSKAPPRADVVRSLRNGIIVNLLGMGSAILGMQATVGLLVAKALTTSANPYQGIPSGTSPVLGLDVFLVQASANTILSHFLGVVCSLELLRSVTQPESVPVMKMA